MERRNQALLAGVLALGLALGLAQWLFPGGDAVEAAAEEPESVAVSPRSSPKGAAILPGDEAEDEEPEVTCTLTAQMSYAEGAVTADELQVVRELKWEPYSYYREPIVDGEAHFTELPTGFWYRATLDAEGAVPQSRSAFCPDEGGDLTLDIALRAASAWFEGQLTDTEGYVLDGTVSVVEAEREKEVFDLPVQVETVDGRYRVGVIPGRAYNVTGNADGYRFSGGVTQHPEAGETVTLNFKLKLESSIQGVVVDQDGAPVAGATVYRYPATTRTTTTDEDGAFIISTTPGYEHQVAARKDGQVGTAWIGKVEEGVDKYNARIELAEGRTIRGEVVHAETGAPVGDTTVVWSAMGSGLLERVPVDEDGDFIATGVPHTWEPDPNIIASAIPSGHIRFFIHDRARPTEPNMVGVGPDEDTVEVLFVPKVD